MAADGISPALAIRSSVGVELWQPTTDANKTYAINEQFARDESKFCRAIEFSPDGQYLAWANGSKVQIATVNNWTVICSLPRPKAFVIKFSPKGTYLATLEHYSTPKDGSEPQPNFCVYRTSTGELVYSLIIKSFSDEWWPGWSNDEALFGLMVGGEALFFDTTSADGFQKPARKIGSCRGGELTIAGGGGNPHVALYVPGAKGAPSVCKIYRYPAIDAVVASKSFFQADRIEMIWNKRASGMILLTSTEVDTTGASYYGKQALHFMNTKGDSCSVPLSKEGPIHAVQWNPKGTEFCVVYGYMPAKATFFNLKCDPIFEVKEAPRNSIYYNSYGNIVLLAGFGNLRGNVEVWNVKEKKLVTTFQAPDSTMLEWSPNGENILTATTAPRLRIGNGFKVWHYSGALLHETVWPSGQELLQVIWQQYPEGTSTEPTISNVKVQGIQPSQPQSSTTKYVPPNIRSGGAISATPRPYTDNHQPTERGPIPGIPIGYKVSQSKLKKERNARRKNNENASSNSNDDANAAVPNQQATDSTNPPTTNNKQRNRNQRRNQPKQQENGQSANDANTNTDLAAASTQQSPNADGPTEQGSPDGTDANKEKPKVKRTRDYRRALQKKLRDIEKLKVRRDNGEKLEANQLTSINSEAEIVAKLNSLTVGNVAA